MIDAKKLRELSERAAESEAASLALKSAGKDEEDAALLAMVGDHSRLSIFLHANVPAILSLAEENERMRKAIHDAGLCVKNITDCGACSECDSEAKSASRILCQALTPAASAKGEGAAGVVKEVGNE